MGTNGKIMKLNLTDNSKQQGRQTVKLRGVRKGHSPLLYASDPDFLAAI